jgi:hypothetical protein
MHKSEHILVDTDGMGLISLEMFQLSAERRHNDLHVRPVSLAWDVHQSIRHWGKVELATVQRSDMT